MPTCIILSLSLSAADEQKEYGRPRQRRAGTRGQLRILGLDSIGQHLSRSGYISNPALRITYSTYVR